MLFLKLVQINVLRYEPLAVNGPQPTLFLGFMRVSLLYFKFEFLLLVLHFLSILLLKCTHEHILDLLLDIRSDFRIELINFSLLELLLLFLLLLARIFEIIDSIQAYE